MEMLMQKCACVRVAAVQHQRHKEATLTQRQHVILKLEPGSGQISLSERSGHMDRHVSALSARGGRGGGGCDGHLCRPEPCHSHRLRTALINVSGG